MAARGTWHCPQNGLHSTPSTWAQGAGADQEAAARGVSAQGPLTYQSRHGDASRESTLTSRVRQTYQGAGHTLCSMPSPPHPRAHSPLQDRHGQCCSEAWQLGALKPGRAERTTLLRNDTRVRESLTWQQGMPGRASGVLACSRKFLGEGEALCWLPPSVRFHLPRSRGRLRWLSQARATSTTGRPKRWQ